MGYKCGYLHSRKKMFACVLAFTIITFIVMFFNSSGSRLFEENTREEELEIMKNRIRFLEQQYREKQEEVYRCQDNSMGIVNVTQDGYETSTLSSEVIALLQNISGSKAAEGLKPPAVTDSIKDNISYQLLPHLLDNPSSLRLAYHMSGGREYSDVVIGIPTVKRDKESYLLTTLEHLIYGLDERTVNATMIVVMVGETKLDYVITVARTIELTFPTQVAEGLIEVISPNPSYYPDWDKIPLSLGDSKKRVIWRTKQNLDVLFLMAYAKNKGFYYLMLEDDVIAKEGYMTDILKETTRHIDTNNNEPWFFINFSTTGGIGKLFKTSDLQRFITYVQMFYVNMPIDWLLESYLADRVCGIDKTTKLCGEQKAKIRPTYKVNLFDHIGLFSSLKGKLQKVKDKRFGKLPAFYTHDNPPVKEIVCTINAYKTENSIESAYYGKNYFWGVQPRKGDVIEFWFKEPIEIERFIFRTGNLEHFTDKFTNTVVEVLTDKLNANFTTVGYFDEFGLADGDIDHKLFPISCLRLRVVDEIKLWVILNEIEIKTVEEAEKS